MGNRSQLVTFRTSLSWNGFPAAIPRSAEAGFPLAPPSGVTIGTSIWSADSEVAGRTIEQHVYKLRKKLQLGPERGAIIRTAYSKGYRLELAAEAAKGDGPAPSDASL